MFVARVVRTSRPRADVLSVQCRPAISQCRVKGISGEMDGWMDGWMETGTRVRPLYISSDGTVSPWVPLFFVSFYVFVGPTHSARAPARSPLPSDTQIAQQTTQRSGPMGWSRNHASGLALSDGRLKSVFWKIGSRTIA